MPFGIVCWLKRTSCVEANGLLPMCTGTATTAMRNNSVYWRFPRGPKILLTPLQFTIIDGNVAGPYDDAVFSDHTFLAAQFLQAGGVALLYSLAILGWGDVLCRRFRALEDSFSNFFVTRLLTGCVVLYAVFIALAAGHILRPTPIAIVLIAGLVFALLRSRQIAARLLQALQKIWYQNEKILVSAVFVLVALQIACGFAPLTFYDSQVYQLLGPVEFLRAGHLAFIPWNVLTNGPLGIQLTFGMSWIADPTGNAFKLLMTLFGCLSVLAAARLGSELGFRSAMIGALFVLTYPEFWIQQTLGAVDLSVASFLVFGAMWWIHGLKQQSWIWTMFSGIAFGYAVSSRYQAVVLVVWVLGAGVAAESFRNRSINRQHILKCVAVAALIAVMASPWLLRNYANMGNPVYPLMYGSLGGPEWSPDQAQRLQAEVMGPSILQLGAAQMIVAPFGALLMTPGNGLFGLGLLLGSLIGLSVVSVNIRLYAAMGIGGLIIWGLLRPTPAVQLLRFNAASLIIMLACTGAIVGSGLIREMKGTYVAATLALGSLVIAMVALHGIVPVWKTLTSSSARAEYSRANVPSWEVIGFANGKLDPGRHRVLMVGETRAVWLRVPFLAASAHNGPQLTQVFSSEAGANAWLARLHELGVTHILICSYDWQRLADAFGYFRLADDHLRRFTEWLHTLPVLFDDRRGNVLLELPSS